MKSQRPPSRLLLEEPIGCRRELSLPADQANYVNRVLRLRVGSPIVVFDGKGSEFLAHIVRYRKGAALLELDEPLSVMPQPDLRIAFIQGISKADRMDFAVQKTTELGVAEIFPVYTRFSIVKLDSDRAARRRIHWQRVAGSACEQSGRHFPPLVHAPQNLQDCVQALPPSAPRLAFDPRGDNKLGMMRGDADTVTAVVGPEGGFSPDELEMLRDEGFKLVRLGSQILRTETAAIVATTLLQARWGSLRHLYEQAD